ncbi:MAG: SDR family oxidoreductase [Acidimicrobiales bacterium]
MTSGVTVVTGGSRGIRAATALLLAANGDPVCITYRSQVEAAQTVVEQCMALGVQAKAVEMDLADEQSIVNVFAQARAEFTSIAGLVNNAGILHVQSRLVDMSAARIREVFEINVVGAMLCAREAVRHMSRSQGANGGAIVNVSSIASRIGSANEYIDYAASKGALDSFTVGLAKEVANEGIRVNAVRPGLIYTDIHASGGEPGRVDRLGPSLPMGRGGTPQEVADGIVFLLGENASYITGTFLDVSGGR